jgi:hypothetical protein
MMSVKDVKFVDGLREQLKSGQPLPEEDSNPLYTLMQEKSLTGYELGKIAREIHAYRPMEKNRLGEEVQAPEKETLLLTDATPNRVSFAVVDRKPQEDGTYNSFARAVIERDDKGTWRVSDFFTSLDPTGYDKQEAGRYVNLADGLRDSYKNNDQKFVADFLQALSKGEDMWGALTAADYMGKIDNVFDAARREEQTRLKAGEGPIALTKIKAGRVPGTYDYFSGGEQKSDRRVSVAPILRHER